MARRLRIQFAGAVYHVINRGNYRRDVFETTDKAEAFERSLFETCVRMRWRLYAYVLMRNHFHLAVETTEPNLVEGMHWLQTTFATRFNRFRRENGHLFQGRYHALLVEPGESLKRVVDYIHLNPVRAGIISAERVTDFRWGSMRRFVRGERSACLHADAWLAVAGLMDNAEDWKLYRESLIELSASTSRQEELGFSKMSRGWAIGTLGWRRALAKDYAHRALAPGVPARELIDLNDFQCDRVLQELLQAAGKTSDAICGERKGVAWKVKIAAILRATSPASNRWIATKLHMGTPGSVSYYLSLAKHGKLKI